MKNHQRQTALKRHNEGITPDPANTPKTATMTPPPAAKRAKYAEAPASITPPPAQQQWTSYLNQQQQQYAQHLQNIVQFPHTDIGLQLGFMHEQIIRQNVRIGQLEAENRSLYSMLIHQHKMMNMQQQQIQQLGRFVFGPPVAPVDPQQPPLNNGVPADLPPMASPIQAPAIPPYPQNTGTTLVMEDDHYWTNFVTQDNTQDMPHLTPSAPGSPR